MIENEEHAPLEVQQLTAIATSTTAAVIYNQQIYAIEQGQLCARTLQGTVRKTLSFREIEGNICVLDCNSKWLVVGSTHAYIVSNSLVLKHKLCFSAFTIWTTTSVKFTTLLSWVLFKTSIGSQQFA